MQNIATLKKSPKLFTPFDFTQPQIDVIVFQKPYLLFLKLWYRLAEEWSTPVNWEKDPAIKAKRRRYDCVV